jgi:hypothetical protein
MLHESDSGRGDDIVLCSEFTGRKVYETHPYTHVLTPLAQYCLCLVDRQQGTLDVLLVLCEITKHDRIKELTNTYARGWGALHPLTVLQGLQCKQTSTFQPTFVQGDDVDYYEHNNYTNCQFQICLNKGN